MIYRGAAGVETGPYIPGFWPDPSLLTLKPQCLSMCTQAHAAHALAALQCFLGFCSANPSCISTALWSFGNMPAEVWKALKS